MRTKTKAVCWSAVTAVALVSGAMMVMTGCVNTTTWDAPPSDDDRQGDYTNTLEVATATVGDYTYTYVVTNGGAIIIGPTRTIELRGKRIDTQYRRAILPAPTGVLSIPATLDGYPVTSIGEWASPWSLNLKRVTIPPGVTSIGDHAFMVCTGLTSVDIPSSVASIGNYSFWGCKKLKNVDFPSGVTSIGEGAFRECIGLKSVTIPSSVTSIKRDAFDDCTDLKSVTILSNVVSIERNAFGGCTRLKSVVIPNGATVERDAFPKGCQILWK